MKHRILQLLLCAVFAVALLSAPVAAATDGDYEYSVDSGNATITDYTGSAANLTIPSTLGGYPVTVIDNYAFRDCTGLTSVIIPSSVTYIGESAFEDCTGLTSVTIGDSVTEIDSGAFSGCTGLTSVTIGNSVTYIGWDAFHGCTGLTSVIIPNSVTQIDEFAFCNCTGLTSVAIPNSVTDLGYYAFSGCTGLTAVNIDSNNSNYKSIDGIVFSKDGTKLVLYPIGKAGTYTVPDSVTYIDYYAFSDCTGLTSVTIPDSVTALGYYAFSGCTGLTAINVNSNNSNYKSIDGVVFSKDGTKLVAYAGGKIGTYTLPDGVTKIATSAFSRCTGLTSVTIGNSVTDISDWAFEYCTGLTSVTIPDSVTNIGERAFDGCTSLTTINVGSNNSSYTSTDGVVFSKDGTKLVLYPCGKAGAYTVPDSVTEIGTRAFYDCTGLTSVTIGNSVTYIGESAFEGCTGLTAINVDSNNSNYKSIDGVLYSKDVTRLIFCPQGKTGSLIIPFSVTEISGFAIFDCTTLTAIAILNPNTIITPGPKEPSIDSCPNATIYCDDPSTAKDFAIECNMPYKPLSEFPGGLSTVKVTGVTLNKDKLSLIIGNTGTLTATVAPDNATNKNVTWSSDQTSVATVDGNGKVTAKAAGTANITVKTEDGNFTASCAVTVVAAATFSDVSKDAWYYPYVTDLASTGIINGKGGGIFDPNGTIKRCEFAKILAIASGDDLSNYNGQTKFGDVSRNAWYATYVQWANENGIVNGKNATAFAPEDKISRQEMAVMIKRYADYKKITLPKTNAAITFADDSSIASWAKEAVSAMQQAGIINGKGGNVFDPLGNATRGEAAKMISVFLAIK